MSKRLVILTAVLMPALAGCDALETAGLAATVLWTTTDLPPPTDNAAPAEIAKDAASRIEDLVMTPV